MLIQPVDSIDSTFKLKNLNKCVTIKKHDDIYHHYGQSCKMSVIGCDESNIYIDSAVETLLVSSCINCTIFVAAVSKICTIEKCENVTLCVASKQLRIGNCIDSIIYTYTPEYPPIVYGDTRNLRLAPHNASYLLMLDHLAKAKIPFEQGDSLSEKFVENINNFRKPITLGKGQKSERTESSNKSGGSHQTLHHVDFNKMVLPQFMQDAVGSNG